MQGDDPYEAALKYFADILTPDGVVVIAIENQFGLKYFNACREDHIGAKFEGLEGYHHRKAGVRTFGKIELETYIKRYFADVRFFYPFPDYKIPDCVLSTEFINSERAGEVISQMVSRDYSGPDQPLWDEATAVLELARNRMLGFFSNSFLVVAGRTQIRGVNFDQLARIFSSGRKSEFATQTRIVEGVNRNWIVSKRSRKGGGVAGGMIKMVDTEARWAGGQSLLTQATVRAKSNDLDLDEMFEPCGGWLARLIAESTVQNGVVSVSGSHVDSIWSNIYLDGEELRIIDREWIWSSDIPLNVVVIRAIYNFLMAIDGRPNIGRALNARSGRVVINGIASAIGVKLSQKDMDDFIALESEIQWIVSGVSKTQQRIYWRWFLADRPTLRSFIRSRRFFQRCKERAESVSSRLAARLLPKLRWARQ